MSAPFVYLKALARRAAYTMMPPARIYNLYLAMRPERIALLRLDTDWYESTKAELTHLYPPLSPGGVLLVDDYGQWLGQREAVDEYFSTAAERPLLKRIDQSSRMGIKPGGAGGGAA